MSTAFPVPGPLSLGELLDRAFRLYRKYFASFISIAALFLLPFAIVSTLVTGSTMVGYFDLLQSLAQTPVAPPDETFGRAIAPVGQFIGATMLMTLIGFAVNGLVLLALTAQAIGALRGTPLTLGEAARTALKRFWSYIGMTILSALAFAGVTAAIGILFILVFGVMVGGLGGLAYVLRENTDVSIALGIGLVALTICLYAMAIVLFAAPLLYLYARWFVAAPGIVDQDWSAVESLRGSWRLTKGAVMRCGGYAILLWVLGIVVMAAPLYILQWMMFIVLPTNAFFLFPLLSLVASTLLGVLYQPLSAIAVTLLYFDLRVRRESYDIELRLQSLEAELSLSALAVGAGQTPAFHELRREGLEAANAFALGEGDFQEGADEPDRLDESLALADEIHDVAVAANVQVDRDDTEAETRP